MFLISPYQFTSNASMYSTLLTLGLTTNLKLCLDAGDTESYIGSGQTWTDRSGGGYDFYRGTTSGAEGSDPTFNGTAGHNSSGEYFSVDGGDWFTLAQANPSWVNNIHKAGAVFTIAEWVYLNAANNGAFGRIGDELAAGLINVVGFEFGGGSTFGLRPNFYVDNGSAQVYQKASTTSGIDNSWNFLAISVNIPTGVVIFGINGSTDTFTSQSYTSPSAAAAGSTVQIGAFGAGQTPEKSGDRFNSVAMWSDALSASQLVSLFTATRGKFGV